MSGRWPCKFASIPLRYTDDRCPNNPDPITKCPKTLNPELPWTPKLPIVNPRKLEHGFKMTSAGIPYVLPEGHADIDVPTLWLFLPLESREWKNGSNSSYNCTPFLHSLLTKSKSYCKPSPEYTAVWARPDRLGILGVALLVLAA